MFRGSLLRKPFTGLRNSGLRNPTYTYYSTRSSDPLRILFCGSDEFSIASLRALHAEQKQNPSLIESIDVLCRPGKATGRNLKQFREAPIKAVALGFDLSVHERDTFTGWQLPTPGGETINLIIAVSFGLFVPPRILRSAKYGGLNVHPSLLPKFRGPAPLQHIIIAGEETTGVTLQTLDDQFFDHGVILSQTSPPGLPIPFSSKCTYQELLKFVTPKAAEMLVQGIRNRLFVPPLKDVGVYNQTKDLLHAPKITQEDKRIRWNDQNGATGADRRYRALGRLWTEVSDNADCPKRMLCEGISEIGLEKVFQDRNNNKLAQEHKSSDEWFDKPDGVLIMSTYRSDSWPFGDRLPYWEDGDAIVVAVPGQKGSALRIEQITLEGMARKSARQAAKLLAR